jgi:hypothetical protein
MIFKRTHVRNQQVYQKSKICHSKLSIAYRLKYVEKIAKENEQEIQVTEVSQTLSKSIISESV